MKRDMDLVRLILKELSESSQPLSAQVFTATTYPFELIAYHYEIMTEAGLIRTDITREMGGTITSAYASSLTWSGNDFLAAVSSDSIWAKTKQTIGKFVGDASLATIKALAEKISSEMLLS